MLKFGDIRDDDFLKADDKADFYTHFHRKKKFIKYHQNFSI